MELHLQLLCVSWASMRTPHFLVIPVLSLAAACSSDPVGSTPLRADAAPPIEVDAAPSVDASPDAGAPLEGDIERFAVTDGLLPKVTVVDTAQGIVGSFDVSGVGAVYGGASGKYAYVAQGAQNVVHVVDMGIDEEDHGAHSHFYRRSPKLMATPITGTLPIHVVGHDGHVAAFFDDDGSAQLLDERDLDQGKVSFLTISTGMPHHGFAVPFSGKVLATRPELAPGSTRAVPNGLDVHSRIGAKEMAIAEGCPIAHGEAAKANVAVVGCADGALVVVPENGSFTGKKIANPAGLVGRVGTVVEHPSVRVFLANYGADKLALIDAAALTMTVFDAPAGGVIQFAFADDGRILVLTRDGKIHRLAADGSPGESLLVTSPATDDANHGAKFPGFAPALGGLLITDPPKGQVHRVTTNPLRIQRSFAVPGSPTKIASSVFEKHEH